MFGSGDVEAALANSVIYLEAFGHVVVAWIWLEQLLAANGRSGDFYDGKRQAARYFFRYELPRTAPNWICWRAWTAPPWRCATAGSNAQKYRPMPYQAWPGTASAE